MKCAWKYSLFTAELGDLPVRHFIVPLIARLGQPKNHLNIGLWCLNQNIIQSYALLKLKKITSILFSFSVKPRSQTCTIIKSVQQWGCMRLVWVCSEWFLSLLLGCGVFLFGLVVCFCLFVFYYYCCII